MTRKVGLTKVIQAEQLRDPVSRCMIHERLSGHLAKVNIMLTDWQEWEVCLFAMDTQIDTFCEPKGKQMILSLTTISNSNKYAHFILIFITLTLLFMLAILQHGHIYLHYILP